MNGPNSSQCLDLSSTAKAEIESNITTRGNHLHILASLVARFACSIQSNWYLPQYKMTGQHKSPGSIVRTFQASFTFAGCLAAVGDRNLSRLRAGNTVRVGREAGNCSQPAGRARLCGPDLHPSLTWSQRCRARTARRGRRTRRAACRGVT